MKTTQTFSILFWANKAKSTSDGLPLFARITIDGKRAEISLKRKVDPEIEANKFFNHYQANGWKIAGKTPMEDWQASANKWMLNAQNFETKAKAKPGPTNLNKNKKYDIPL
jgi:hypothetical protein